MARTIDEIKNNMLAQVAADEVLSANLTSTSITAIWRLIIGVVAYAIFILENLFDIFRAEITAEMAAQKPHTKDWYRSKALAFLYGVPLTSGTDQFDTTDLTDDQITAASIVKQAAAVKLISDAGYGILRVKVATGAGSVLEALSAAQLAAVRAYMNQVVDAGTQLTVTSSEADKLKLVIDVYYDPLVLSPTGARLDASSNTPVPDAIDAFLASIDFNGTWNKKLNEAAIMAVEGVLYANITAAASKYGAYNYEDTGITNVGAIDMFRIADAGYFTADDITINYKLSE